MEKNINEKSRVLIIGATGRVGSQVVKSLDQNSKEINVRLSSTDFETVNNWKNEGRESVLLNLDEPETFAPALEGVDRVFLLTGYTSDMLRQSKMLVDAAVDADVKHIVHLGVFTSRRDLIPHFIWHDMIETYIAASGLAWTNIHPNVIADSVLNGESSLKESKFFQNMWNETPMGWVFASDIGAVAAAVLREGPEKHDGKDYFLSTEVLNSPEVAKILSEASGLAISCTYTDTKSFAAYIEQIPSVPTRAYMESALKSMELAIAGKLQAQTVVKDDVMTVLGRPGLTMAKWAKTNLI